MSGPWEEYKEDGPWNEYKQDEPINPVTRAKQSSVETGNATLRQRSQDHATRMATDPYYRTSNESGFGKNALSQMGGVMYGLGYLGPKQIIGKDKPGEVDAYRASMRGSADAPGGTTGAMGGYMASAAPAVLVPGANTLTGSTLIGTALGALEPVGAGESRGRNMIQSGAGAFAGNALGKYLGSKLATNTSNKLSRAASDKAKFSVRDATLAEGQAAGYVVPPSYAGQGAKGRVLEMLSGKYKTNQAAGIRNQEVTDRLARQALGIADDEPLTKEAMAEVRRAAASQGYAPIASIGAVPTDDVFMKSLDDITANLNKASQSFPGAVDDSVAKLVEPLRVQGFDADGALEMVQILRDKADDAYRTGNSGLGKANKAAAKAIEDQIERHLESGGKDSAAMLKAFRDARTQMAKSHTVEKAIREGGGTVDALKIGGELQRGKPLTGELATIGKFANNYRDVAGIPKSGAANPSTVVDAAVGAGAIGSGNIPLALLPLARPVARNRVLSPAFQAAKVHPNYAVNPNLLRISRFMNDPVAQSIMGMSVPGLLSTYE
jgi:hypothetical protein